MDLLALQKIARSATPFVSTSFCLAILHLACILPQASSQETITSTNLLTLETSRVASQIVMQPCGAEWKRQPLRSGLESLSRAYGLSIWLDRRIDPSTTISFSLPASSTLRDCLDSIASQCNAESGFVENVWLIAPRDVTARIQRSAVVTHSQLVALDYRDASVRRKLTWSDITTSQELLGKISDLWSIPIRGEIPHDLFHAGELPECSLATQLAVLCGGFDLQVDLKSPSISGNLAPLAQDSAWQATYDNTALNLGLLNSLLGDETTASVKRRNTQSIVKGTTNFHQRLLSPARVNNSRSAKPGSKVVWSFEISQLPIDAVLGNIAQRLEFELQWSPSCTAEQKKKLITVSIDKLTRDELLEQICRAADLRFEAKNNIISIEPR